MGFAATSIGDSLLGSIFPTDSIFAPAFGVRRLAAAFTLGAGAFSNPKSFFVSLSEMFFEILSIPSAGIALGEIPGFEVASLIADLTIAVGIAPTASFLFEPLKARAALVFALAAADFMTALAAGVSTFLDFNFTLPFDKAIFSVLADDETVEFFLDLPDFIGERIATCACNTPKIFTLP